MSGWPVFDAATVLQTAAFVLNWKREYDYGSNISARNEEFSWPRFGT